MNPSEGHMRHPNWWARVKRIWIASGIALTVGFVAWSLIAYRANAEAHAATVSDAVVANMRGHGVWRFVPVDVATPPPVGLLFFPGALVDPTADAPLARAVSPCATCRAGSDARRHPRT